MTLKKGKLFYIRRRDETDILIFDAGFEKGNLYIYVEKEIRKVTELREILLKYGFNESTSQLYDITPLSGISFWLENSRYKAC
ncbi:MAG: hypothetical protein ACFE9L_11960 [Candidatus Hodarchaeota archaeon]